MVPLANGEVVAIVSGASMVKANAFVAITLLVSVTSIVKFDVAAVPDWPLIAPVTEFNVRPAGKDPTLTDHV